MTTAAYKGNTYIFKNAQTAADVTDFWEPASGKSVVIVGFCACVIGASDPANYARLTDGTNTIVTWGAAGGATGGTNWVANDLNWRFPPDTTIQLLEEGTLTAMFVTVWGYEV